VVADPVDAPPLDPYALRVGTKYPRVTMSYFGERAVAVEIIELSGSVELAPILGLADCIVDVVETGQTLKENGLAVVDVVTASSGRLVVNRASYQLKAVAVNALIDALSKVVEEDVNSRMVDASSRMIA
jgi:ATP phosphoribosyltransferase